MTPPKHLRTSDGLLKPIPPDLLAHFRCPVCQELLYRSDSGWCCAVSLSHTKLIRDYELEEVIQPLLKPRRKAKNVLRFVLARQRWCCRNKVDPE